MQQDITQEVDTDLKPLKKNTQIETSTQAAEMKEKR